MVAPIQMGYYLIGRDSECQIRPKTRSVSRTHCLLFYGIGSPDPNKRERRKIAQSSGVARMYLFDLHSTAGTMIDGRRVPSGVWIPVANDVELRCGKIAWRVAISQISPVGNRAALPTSDPSPQNQMPSSDESAKHEADLEASLANSGLPTSLHDDAPEGEAEVHDVPSVGLDQAFEEDAVAAFLDAHDHAEREKRYSRIRQKDYGEKERFGGADPNEPFDENPQTERDVTGKRFPKSIDGDDDESTTDTEIDDSGQLDSGQLDTEEVDLSDSDVVLEERAEKKPDPKPERPVNMTKAKARRSRPSMDFSGLVSFERLKLALAFVLTLVVIGFFAQQVMKFMAKPPADVRQGFD